MARYDRLRRRAKTNYTGLNEARRALGALRKHASSAGDKLEIDPSLYLILLIEHMNDYKWPQLLV